MNSTKLLCLLSFAGVLAGCSTASHEVIRYRGDVLRAPMHNEASRYCKERGTTAQIQGAAPGDTGVLFRCV
ncbi:MAG: hypothetical protein EOP81_04720 [Variovorax sp.]|nr:MAG: hypothetical protein EOP81_04720 [Variovorax sp.]